ncbi:hypothetical protein [Cloacibacillus sp. An23]|uniref:hypothetical protein n=1 Tax=Cloacibacillus sp. An23 TaxID=1965591 RepID=UPI001178207F|nr:hypothetical protein [Cloacibacillus sp. An23]
MWNSSLKNYFNMFILSQFRRFVHVFCIFPAAARPAYENNADILESPQTEPRLLYRKTHSAHGSGMDFLNARRRFRAFLQKLQNRNAPQQSAAETQDYAERASYCRKHRAVQ